MTRFITLFSILFLPVIILAQPKENDKPDHAMLQWAETYNIESRIAKSKLEMQRWLASPAPFLMTEWENLGPNTMDTLSGRVITMTIDPSNSERLYIGSGSGGLWRSENGGDSWEPLTDAAPSPHVSAIAINPVNSDEILIGTGIGQVPTSTLAVGIGVLRSTDGGMSWENTSFSFNQGVQVSVYEIIWDADVPDKVYLAATNGLYESLDGGQTWQNLIPFVRIYDFELHPTEPETLFVAAQNQGIRRSTDGGENWENLDNGMPSGNQIFRCGITICESSPDIMYASLIAASDFGPLGLYRSEDGGDSWIQLQNAPRFTCQPSNLTSCQGWLFHDIAVAPDDPQKILLGSVQLWYSLDGGQSWTWRDYAANGSTGGNVGLTYVDSWDFQYHPNEQGIVYVCNDGGVQKSTDYGQNWVRMSNDLVIGQTYSVATQKDDPDFMIGGYHDHGLQRLFATNDNQTWTRWSLGDGIQTIIDHSNPNILYGNLQNGTPLKSNVKGSSHLTTIAITNGINESGPWITPLEMDPKNSNVLFTSSNNFLYKTSNGGNSWQTKLNVNTVRSIAINQLRPDTVYAHAFNSTSWSLWRSHDGGENWSQVNATNIPSWGVTNLESSPHDSETLYAVRNSANPNNDHVKVSFNNGDSWADITNDLPDIMVRDILVSPLSSDHLYLATELGVYMSENGGDNWKPWNFNLPIIEVYDVDFAEADSTIRIATMGRGVWKTPALLPEPSNVDDLNFWAQSLDLQVYPNPTSGLVQIDFHLQEANVLTFKLLNATGQVLYEWNYNLPSGQQRIDLNLEKFALPKSVYFLRAEMGNKALHKKLVIE